MAEHLITQTMLNDSPWTLFLLPKIFVKFLWGHPNWGAICTSSRKNVQLLTSNLLCVEINQSIFRVALVAMPVLGHYGCYS